jgi:hypothetical protein
VYTRAYDRSRGLLFGLWSGAHNSDDDFDRAAADVLMLDREGADLPAGVVHIAETDDENPVPSQAQRKQLSRAAEAVSRSKVYYFCMVTRSPLVRGVITLLGWFAPRQGPHVNGCQADFETALAWAEKYRPGVSDRFRALRSEARAAASAGAAFGPDGQRVR